MTVLEIIIWTFHIIGIGINNILAKNIIESTVQKKIIINEIKRRQWLFSHSDKYNYHLIKYKKWYYQRYDSQYGHRDCKRFIFYNRILRVGGTIITFVHTNEFCCSLNVIIRLLFI